MVKGISKLVMDLTVRLTCVKGKVKSDSRFDLSFAKDQMCSKSNFSSRGSFLPLTPDMASLIGFKISFRKEGSDIYRVEKISVSNITMYTKNVTGLAKFTQYGFHVLAFTSAGDGMNSSVLFDSKHEKTDESPRPLGRGFFLFSSVWKPR